ncbi:MAG: phosphatidylserine decarboxylase related protein [Bryobacterales bacterium]|nr:phosphatidylserine decarboxylase related protein [Bryobacterales bacterium]
MRIVSDGINYATGFIVVAILLSIFVNPWVATPLYILAAFCLYFFRDPERIPPSGEVMVAPADGKVVEIRATGPNETRISIFLNIFNVHVNRTPIPGVIKDVVYREGKFLVASHEAASADNEQNTLVVEGRGTRVVCRQIAGLIARRIICYKKPGDLLAPGERIGYIKFGSRVDVLYGPEWQTAVKVGDKVAAGTTILANRVSGPEAI